MMTITHLKLHPPAKANLWLYVHRKREDGYHEIETRMCPLSLTDELELELEERKGVRLICADSSVPDGEDNLVVKAARAFEQRTGIEIGIKATLKKNIPAGAGLGGGSSDAASTLKGLNQLYGAGLSDEELREVAAGVGSDVPFFIFEGVCDCRGRGELVEAVDFDWELPVVLIKPAFGVETTWAYRRWEHAREIPGVSYAPQLCYWGSIVNELERPVFEKFLVLAQMKMWLLEQEETQAVVMSGSGSTMMIILATEHGGEHLVEKVKRTFGATTWTYVGHTLGS